MAMTKEKNIENDAVVTDQFALINGIVDLRMKAYVIFNASEHQQTRKEVKDLKNVVLTLKDSGVHNIVQDVVIACIIIFMVLVLTGC